MPHSVIDYRRASFEAAAALARPHKGTALAELVAQIRKCVQCDAVLLLEQTDALTATCRLSAGADGMIESISDPALLTDALSSFECVIYPDYPRSDRANQTLLGWGARSVSVLPAARKGEVGGAVVLVWKTPQAFPADFTDAIAPVWALLQALYPGQKAERDLEEARERLSAILETIPQAIVFIDDDGERGWVNGPAATLFHLPSGNTSPLSISNAMRNLRATATNSAVLQEQARYLLRNARAEIRDWQWEFDNPRRVLSVSSRVTSVRGVFGRIWVLLDITALKAAEAALARQEERWQLALDGTNEGIWDWNALTGEVFYSPRWKEMLGYAASELPNDSAVWEQLLHPEDLTRTKAALQKHLNRETPYYIAEYRIRCKDDSYKWVLARGKAIWDDEGRPLRLVGAHSDVSDRRRGEELLCEAKQAADHANAAKSQFLARMSHEIRTPMNAICGLSDLLYESPLNEEQREYVRIFRSNADRLLRLINDILDLSRVEAGALNLKIASFRPDQVIARVRDLFLALARQKKLQLRFTLDPGLPPVLRGDPDRLEQILVNLVGNALKFTEFGEVTVRAEPNPQDLREGNIAFEVTDTGPGISADQCAMIFEPFVQADSSTTRKHHGTGLGLAIAKKLVETMGGEISVRSEPGKGSCFRFNVLLEPDSASAEAEPAEAERATAQDVTPEFAFDRAARLLIAEDNEDNQFLLRACLKSLPLDLDFAEDGAIALRKALGQSYDLILMDMQMPELDGCEVTRRIREYERARRKPPVPIIALTAHALLEERRRCLDAGCTGYLTKPVSKQDLVREIQSSLGRDATNSPAAYSQLDTIYPEIRALVPGFLARCNEHVEKLVALVDQGDFAAIQAVGHNLKGSGGSFGLPRLSEIGSKIYADAAVRNTEDLRVQIAALREAILEGFRALQKL